MLFNSGVFVVFFAAFLLGYYVVRNHLMARNVAIIIASYIFYGAWDWRFLTLLIGSSFLDYWVGRGLGAMRSPAARKWLVTLSITANLTLLGFFKYFDFFIRSFADLLATFHIPSNLHTLGIILPVGISFYTFQTMSYALDVYRGKMQPTRDLVQFMAYVAFFPQLVAGPIERAAHLLPQFAQTVTITRAMLREAIWLCIWGMFKKVVVADNLAPLVEMVYGHEHPGAAGVVLGTIAFALQIYGDFSGYSDIARGTAKMLGFELMLNFNLPYIASNVREFWQRWHISLSTWLRDYLYISLGGNRCGNVRTCFNLMTTMLLGGLWHGAKWTFVLWGALQGAGLVIHRLWSGRTFGESAGKVVSSGPQQGAPKVGSSPQATAWHPASWLLTMIFVLYSWLLFRADSFRHIVALTKQLGNFSAPPWIGDYCMHLIVFSLPLLLMQAWQQWSRDLLVMLRLPDWLLACLEGVLLIGIMLYWEKEKVLFIYFKF